MSDQITTALSQQYHSNVEMLVQQRGSVTRPFVREETLVGKSGFYDQVGATTARQRTTRHGDSPYIATPHSRRMVVTADYEWGDYIDSFDQVRTLIDPSNSYVQAGAFALGRSIDEVVLAAAFGTAQTGETGGTPLTFANDGGSTIVHGSAGMTIDKLLEAKEILDNNEVDPGERRFIVQTAEQFRDLLGTLQITSADYNSVRALVHGEVDTFLGFQFIRINDSTDFLPKVSTTRDCLAFTERGLLLAVGSDLTARVTERDDKSFSWYAYNCMAIGATRMQGEKFVKIECTEAS